MTARRPHLHPSPARRHRGRDNFFKGCKAKYDAVRLGERCHVHVECVPSVALLLRRQVRLFLLEMEPDGMVPLHPQCLLDGSMLEDFKFFPGRMSFSRVL